MIFSTIVIIIGLALFEIISSVDNAIVNADVLKTMPSKYRKFFLTWGIFFAVIIVRGLLPFILVWIANADLSIGQVFKVALGGGDIGQYLEESKPLLLLGGGVYLVLIFLNWLFMEEKKYAFLAEDFIHRQSAWFYASASVLFTFVIFYALKLNPILALAASIGFAAFFVTDGFRKNAEEQEKKLLSEHLSALSKLLYLEVLDASFSIDGVVGAFAFTMSVPLIILGNGLGALVVRQMTVKGVNLIGRFAYLKNGAMYSIGILGIIMVLESFGADFPFWFAPLCTFILLSLFLVLSLQDLKPKRTYRR